MKIAITGASGHLGATLVRILNQQGIKPRVLTYQNNTALNDADVDVEKFKGDILDPHSLNSFFADRDYVFHLAAKISLSTKPDTSVTAVNVIGTRNVVNACLQQRVKRLIAVSSIHAIHPQGQGRSLSNTNLAQTHARTLTAANVNARTPTSANVNARTTTAANVIDESCDLFAEDEGYPYERSKACAVREAELGRQKGLEVIHIFPPGLIGPYDFQISHMGKFFLDLYHGKLPFTVAGAFHFADIRDTAMSLVTAAEKAKNGDRYLLGGHYIRIADLAKLAGKITGRKAPKYAIPIRFIEILTPLIKSYIHLTGKKELTNAVSKVTLDSLKNYPVLDFSKAKSELNFKLRPLEETIQDIYNWFAKENWL